MLVNHSYYTWVLVKTGGIVFAYPAVAAIIYFILVAAIFGVPGISHPFSIVVEVLGLIEILWYLLFYVPYREHLQKPGYKPPPLDREQRRQLLRQCLDTIPDYDLFQKKWALNGHSEDIRRENVKDWLLWALFERQGPPGSDDDELEEYVQDFESRLGREVKSGLGEAEMLRLDFDRVSMLHRSLLWYLVIGWLDFIAVIGMSLLGFRFYRQPRSTFFTTFPFRPATLVSRASPAPELSYFYRPHRSQKHRPIVLIHGIGIGYISYFPLLYMLPREVGVIAIEMLQVSSRITRPLPPTDVVVEAISTIVAHHQTSDAKFKFPSDFVLTVHSFGSLYVAPLLRDSKISSSIHSLVLMDPVSLLLHLPDVAYNFTRRKPRFANQLQIWLAVGSDANVAHTLARRISWREMLLTREDLLPEGISTEPGTYSGLRRTTVIFGSRDNVTNPDVVASYVYSGSVEYSEVDREEWKGTLTKWTGKGELELMYLDDLDHGQAFLDKAWLPTLGKVLNGYTTREEQIAPEMKDDE